jgi:hypothetical protein
MLPDKVRHAEGCWVRHAKLAFEFLGRDTVPGSCEQVDRVKPLDQLDMALLKDGSDHWMNVVAAVTGERR